MYKGVLVRVHYRQIECCERSNGSWWGTYQRVNDMQTVWYTVRNWGRAWEVGSLVVGLMVVGRRGYAPVWWNCVLWI